MTMKDEILAALSSADGAVSGETLAGRLGVSRNAVWKAIEALRGEGYEIEAVTNRGYRLLETSDVLNEALISGCLKARCFGRKIELLDEIDSTNNYGKRMAAEGAPHGTLVLARSQTGGRGRFSRRFHSPAGSGIYMSLILRPRMPAERAVMITSCAAVAAARAIERLADVDVQIKWVNDLYLQGKKICGILCEAGLDFETGQLDYAVVGIGVNVQPMEFPPELQKIATSVGNICGSRLSRNRLIAEICGCFEALYDEMDSGEFMQEYRARSNVIGKRIRVLGGGESYSARALGIDDQGGLIVETESGVRTVRSGEISVRWETEA